MNYNNEILQKVNIIDNVLKELNQPGVLSNQDFNIDEISSEFYLKAYLNTPSNELSLNIILSNFDIQIDIDRVNEAFVWSNKQIKEEEQEIKDIIKMLFTSNIKVEYCGSNYTKLYFYNKNRICIKTSKYITGLYLKVMCKTKEYRPIYQ